MAGMGSARRQLRAAKQGPCDGRCGGPPILAEAARWTVSRPPRNSAEIADRLADGPSLTPQVDSLPSEVPPRARRQACDALLAFGEQVQIPEVCPYSPEQALDDSFYPGTQGARR